MDGQLSATSARNCIARQKEEEDVLSVVETGITLHGVRYILTSLFT